jgi:hypothetical protein
MVSKPVLWKRERERERERERDKERQRERDREREKVVKKSKTIHVMPLCNSLGWHLTACRTLLVTCCSCCGSPCPHVFSSIPRHSLPSSISLIMEICAQLFWCCPWHPHACGVWAPLHSSPMFVKEDVPRPSPGSFLWSLPLTCPAGIFCSLFCSFNVLLTQPVWTQTPNL